jgi:hypothetical protein
MWFAIEADPPLPQQNIRVPLAYASMSTSAARCIAPGSIVSLARAISFAYSPQYDPASVKGATGNFAGEAAIVGSVTVGGAAV